jgi:hypothetical protein
MKKAAQDDKKDSRQQAIQNNPCSSCRALGLPICRGHGGGGGSSENDKKDVTSAALKNTPTKSVVHSLSMQLEESMLWQESSEEDLLFVCQNALALVTIKINLAEGTLTFEAPENLSEKEKDDLNALYDALINTLNEFKQELAKQGITLDAEYKKEGNNLSIKIPEPKYFDAFVKKLMAKELIPTRAVEWNQVTEAKKQPMVAVTLADVQPDYKAPTPFDTSGPKPKLVRE